MSTLVFSFFVFRPANRQNKLKCKKEFKNKLSVYRRNRLNITEIKYTKSNSVLLQFQNKRASNSNLYHNQKFVRPHRASTYLFVCIYTCVDNEWINFSRRQLDLLMKTNMSHTTWRLPIPENPPYTVELDSDTLSVVKKKTQMLYKVHGHQKWESLSEI
jgi:hypothetical protein